MSEELVNHLSELKVELTDLFEVTCNDETPRDNQGTSDSQKFLADLSTVLLDVQKKAIFLSLIFLDSCRPSLASISSSTKELRDSAYALSTIALRRPVCVGKTLLTNWNDYLRAIFADLVEFVSGLSKAVVENDSSQVKTSIGKICHGVEAFSKLPTSNKQAARLAAQSGLALVEDALEELTADDFPIKSASSNFESTMADLIDNLALRDPSITNSNTINNQNHSDVIMDANDSSDGPQLPDEFVNLESILSDAEIRQLIQIATGLVKTVRACLKKACTVLALPEAQGREESSPHDETIDEIVECCNKMSPTCDEFVLALYPPRRARLLESEATDLAEAMRKLLRSIRDNSHSSLSSQTQTTPENNAGANDTGTEDKQIDILSKAIDHNSNKLLSFLNAQTH